jgi:hypothetical protein
VIEDAAIALNIAIANLQIPLGRRPLTFSFVALTPLHCQIGLLEKKDCARGFFIPADDPVHEMRKKGARHS